MVNDGKATWTSAARSHLGATQTTGNLVIKFTTKNALPADGTFKATASGAIFAADSTSATTCTATCDGTANVVKSTTVADTKKSVEIKLTDACAAAKAVVATCTGNLVNPAAGAVTFGFETSADIVALTGQTGFTTTTATSVSWTGASRSGFLGATQAGGDLVVKFTPWAEVAAGGTVTITPSANIFTADAKTTCTVTSDGTAVATTADDTKSAAAVLAGTQATWTSAARATSLVTGLAGGDLVVKFTPTTEVAAGGTLTITPSANIFTADAATKCTATSDGTAVAVTDADTKTVGAVLTVKMTAKLPAAKAVVITCTDNLKVNGAAGDKITFNFKTSADAALISGATGYTITAAPAATKAPTAAATVAAASTDGVNAGVAFTALC